MLKRIIISIIFCGWATAHAADAISPAPAPLPAKEWDIRIQPYFWATALAGTVQPGPNVPPTTVDANFGDLVENLKFAGMVAAHARRGRFGVSGDVMYVSLRASDTTPGDAFDRARVTTKLFVGSAFVDFIPVENERGELVISAGARAYNSDTELELTPGALPGQSASGSDFWVDPMIGARGRFNVTPKAFVNGWAYVGGFGLGSDFSSDLFAGAGYNFNDRLAANVGYRFMSVDRDTSDFEFDATMNGPFAGLIVSF